MIINQDGCAPWILLMSEAFFLIVIFVEGNSKAVKGSGEAGSSVSAELALSLRRQLMVNNYDYMSSSAEGARVPGPAPHRAPPPPHSAELAPRINEVYISRAHHTVAPDASNTPGPRAPSKKDLLYYIDDTLLSRRVGAGDEVLSDAETKEGKDPVNRIASKGPVIDEKVVNVTEDAAEVIEDLAVEDTTDTTSTAKYKLLKVKTHMLSRRFGRPVYRRILQEEGAEGVALINLSDGSLSDFHLPSPRRHRDSDELRPPDVPPEDLKELNAASATAAEI